ncbi:MAG: argininosuccinate lyase [Candidatus Anstonellaceae archaeon]
MVNKLWGGRFQKEPHQALLAFLSSEDAALDTQLAKFDIEGSLAHVCMLAKQRILKPSEAQELISLLLQLYKQASEGKFTVDESQEDIHTAVELAISKQTDAGKNMHIGRSRNDQISLDMRLYMREAILQLAEGILQVQGSLAKLSSKDTIFPYYTHFQVAQPSSVHLWAHSYFCGFERDIERLLELFERVNVSPLGAGAGTGTDWNIDINYTSSLLGFKAPFKNPIDAVSSRGELEAELLSILVSAMIRCSRISEDIILLSNKKLIFLPDEFSTGSSMMPQKKNPDPFELIRGKAARLFGLYAHCSVLLKNLPTGYSKDSQESKFAVISGVNTALSTFSILSKMLPLLEFNKEKIAKELEDGFASATSLADMLVAKGIPFRKAHELTGKVVNYCISEGKSLSELSSSILSSLTGVSFSEEELAKTLSIDKTNKFKKLYPFPKSSLAAKAVASKKKLLSKARKKLLKAASALVKR